ncbi:MAG: alanine racemase [Candidatus Uhrbacteria bacterium GW2011_GWD2_52_7]|uniref:Alanine racemase n=1 Tax=Candidatus Uhrbacteria bacterium GW2011_GWD2_52_7 TaxID=1618989 RepID=A0A0G1XCI8_9BACT|nr:MAG: alanine racemase [Candidatus Uhrbacteria bacterium GW2011_GWD2_52_7]
MPHGAKTWVEVSGSAVAHNISCLQASLGDQAGFCAVLKANAYGHDLALMTKLCVEQGVTRVAVDWIDEALLVKQLAPSMTVFLLGMTPDERLIDVVRHEFIQTVYDAETVHLLALQAAQIGKKAKVSLKAETGLNRQGLAPRQLDQLLDECVRLGDAIDVVAVGSHFASAEDPGHPANEAQLQAFQTAIERVQGRGFNPAYLHIACSAAAMIHPMSRFTMARVGIAMYGLWSSPELRRTVVLGKTAVDLQPALSWRTRIAQVKDVPSGSGVGYGATHVTNRPIRMAVLPIGYYDGMDRRMSNRSEVIIRGRKCQILGNICMNMCMVDVSAVPGVSRGDIATLIGRDGMHNISADDVASAIGTINYEVVTRINPLLPRVIC